MLPVALDNSALISDAFLQQLIHRTFGIFKVFGNRLNGHIWQ